MTLEIKFILCCSGLSLIASYACWTRFRIWVLRQDLFVVRDNLWDWARANGALDDPAYQETRQAINSLIRLAPYLTVISVVYMVIFRLELRPLLPTTADRPEIASARLDALTVVVRYLLLDTLSGRLVVAFARLCGIARVPWEYLQDRLRYLLEHRQFQLLDGRIRMTARL